MSIADNRRSSGLRLATVLAVPIAAIVLLVLAYNLTAPGGRPSASGTEALGEEEDVLRVGALPVT